ncbi:MAG TPA: hypothetical protein PKY81_15000, partial [bacterium]|nr:hypothetical protein [bacterium]
GYNDTVTVKLTDRFGRTAYDTITQNYYGTSEIKITSPVNGYDTCISPIIISGTSNWSGIGDTVTIYNNTTANTITVLTELNGNWSGTSLLINYGDTIIAKLTDKFGRTAYDTINVNYYPELSVKIKYPITSSSSDYDTYIRIITISGTSINSRQGDTIEAFVNGYYNIVPDTFILSNRNGNWECDLVPLLDGVNRLTVRLTDGFGRVAYDTITLQYFDSGNVSVNITYPLNNTDTYLQSIQVRGTTYNTRTGDIVNLTVNGKDTVAYVLTSDSGSFDTYINLTHTSTIKFGMFSYNFDTTVNNVIAYINSGQGFYDGSFKYSRRIANYFGDPQLAITSPSKINILETNQTNLIVSGTTKYAQTGDTVMLYVNNLLVPQSISNVTVNGIFGVWSGVANVSNYADSVIVKFIDRFGQTVYDTIQVNFFKYPKISITNHLTNYDTSTQDITISGTTQFTRQGDTIELFVNNVKQSSANLTELNGVWSQSVTLSGFGDSITVKLTDKFGRIIYDTIIVNYYGAAGIAITNPIEYNQFNGYDTNIKIIDISGTLSNAGAGDIVKIYAGNILNYETVLSGMTQAFSGTVALTSQTETVYAVINDKFGLNRYDTSSIIIHYFDNPAILIQSPENNSETAVNIINVSGTSYNTNVGDSVELFIRYYNGDTLAFCSRTNIDLLNGNWSGTVSLAGQGDSIIAKLIDKFGVSRYDTIVIKYFGYSLISINEPVPGYNNVLDTFSNSINFAGTSFNSVINDTVFVYRINNESDALYSDSIYLTKFVLSTDTEWSGIMNDKLLSGKNILLFQLKPKVADCSFDTLVIYYLPEIDMKIIAPEHNFDTITSNVIISGTAININGTDTVELFVNGIKQDSLVLNSYNSNWSLNANISGLNDKVNVKLTDQFGRVEEDTIPVNYLSEPKVYILYPERLDYYETNVSIISIRGTADFVRENDTVIITLNGITYSDSKDIINNRYFDDWSINNISLQSGFNTIVLQLTDNFNRTAFDTIMVYYYPELDILIQTPVNSDLTYDTYNNIINISGQTVSTGVGDSVNIYLNGILQNQIVINSIDGSYSADAAVSEQINLIQTVVKDRFGRTDTAQITLIYLPAPEIRITSPLSNVDTNSEYIVASGTSNDVNSGSKIELFVNAIKQSEYILNSLNGNWNGTVKLTGLGDNISVKLTDNFNRNFFDTITINYIKLVDVEISYPSDNICTNVQSIKINGITYNSFEGDTLILYLNNTQISSSIIQEKNGSYEFNGINLSNGNNFITVQLSSKFDGLTDYDTILVKYNDSVNVKFTYPIANTVSQYDTNSTALLLNGVSSANNGNTVNIYINNNPIPSGTALVSDNQWQTMINLNYTLFSKSKNILTAKITDEFTNVSFDSITVFCDLDNPPAVDSSSISKVIDSISENPVIAFRWLKPDMSLEQFGDDLKQYHIYRLAENEILPVYMGSTVNAFYTDATAQYEKNYVYYIQTEDSATNKSDMTQSRVIIAKIYSTENIPQIKVWTKTNSGTTSIFVSLVSYEGGVISCFDGNTVAINASKLNILDTDVTIANGMAEFKLNSSFDTMTKAEIMFQNKIFETQLFMKKLPLPPYPPITYTSEKYKKTYAMIVIPYEMYYYFFMNSDPNLKVKLEKPAGFSATLQAQIAQANEFVRKLTHFVPLSTITNTVETTKGFVFEKSDGSKLTNFDSNYIQLYISYPDEDNDYIVDGTVSPMFKGMPVTSLNFYWLNENSNQWEIVTGGVIDPVNKLVSVRVNHFSIYSVFGANISITLGLKNVKVYPNPFKPNSGLGHTNVIFDNIQPGTKLRLFTVTGQLVAENTTGQNQYRFVWDGKNDHGQSVASGVYIYMLEKGDEKKIGKILVIK